MTMQRALIMFSLGWLAPSIIALIFTGLMLLLIAISGGEEFACATAPMLGMRSSWHNNYVFVTSTRLSRTAQIYLLARKIALPAEVNWHTNRLIVLKVDETDREVASEPWCGIAATYQRRN